MNRTKLLGGAVLMIAALAASTLAGDYADLNFIGFSLDGKYMAFEQFGKLNDGDLESDENYAETYYIDVAKDAYALLPSVYGCDLGEVTQAVCGQRLARYRAKTGVAIKKLKIIRGNTGRQVVAHLLGDWSFVKPGQANDFVTDVNGKDVDRVMPDYMVGIVSRGASAETVVFNPDFFPPGYSSTMFYAMTLTSRKLPKDKPCFEGLALELTLSDKSHHKDLSVQTLHKDGDTIPVARSCPFGYHIEQVFFYKNRLAVFINMFTPGPGIDMRYMAITGKLSVDSVGPHSLTANTGYEPTK
jgi:hypothetical protein